MRRDQIQILGSLRLSAKASPVTGLIHREDSGDGAHRALARGTLRPSKTEKVKINFKQIQMLEEEREVRRHLIILDIKLILKSS